MNELARNILAYLEQGMIASWLVSTLIEEYLQLEVQLGATSGIQATATSQAMRVKWLNCSDIPNKIEIRARRDADVSTLVISPYITIEPLHFSHFFKIIYLRTLHFVQLYPKVKTIEFCSRVTKF
jgi:hypothetical protein